MLHPYTVYLYLLALLAVPAAACSGRSLSVWPCCSLSVRPRGRAVRSACLPARVRVAAWPCSPRPCSPPCAPVPVCARVCVRVRGLARSARLLPCLPAPVPACSHACLRTCARARMRGLLAPVVRAYIVASPAVLLLAVLLAVPAANFFEIVFKPSISIPPSSAWVSDTALYCHAGYFVGVVML